MAENKVKEFLFEIQKKKHSKEVFQGQLTQSLVDRKNVLDLNILVCLDVSGSISSKQFAQFIAQVEAIRGLSRVKILEIDTDIVAFYDYDPSKKNKVARLRGGGGTEFTPAFQMIKNILPDAVLFMTDGFVSGHVAQNLIPIMPIGWVLTHDGKNPYSFGETLFRFER